MAWATIIRIGSNNHIHLEDQPLKVRLFLDALLQILYQVVPGSGPLVVSICARADHENGRLTFAHFRMKPLSEISNRVPPAEARQSTVYHYQYRVDDSIHVPTRGEITLHTQAVYNNERFHRVNKALSQKEVEDGNFFEKIER